MLYYYIFGGIIGICLIGLLIVVIRTFPHVTQIDVELLSRERELKRKREIMNQRFDRWANDQSQRFGAKFGPILSAIGSWFAERHHSLSKMERRLHKATRLARDPEGYREELLTAADAAIEKGDREEAERRLIEMVSVNARDYDAYRRLADLYMDGKDYAEAKEVYAFLIKAGLKQSCEVGSGGVGKWETGIESDAVAAEDRVKACGDVGLAERTELAKHYANLGEACQELGEEMEALRAFDNAVAFEPANPRYLDLLIEACIVEGQKIKAGRALRQLAEVNPENSKLDSFRERIEALAD